MGDDILRFPLIFYFLGTIPTIFQNNRYNPYNKYDTRKCGKHEGCLGCMCCKGCF